MQFGSRDDFFNNGVTVTVLKHLGTVDDSSDKLMIRVIIIYIIATFLTMLFEQEIIGI